MSPATLAALTLIEEGCGHHIRSLLLFWRILLFIARDFYSRALGSLVVLSFPQPLNFSSVFPSLQFETPRRRSDGMVAVWSEALTVTGDG
jgi:hypothetical protein